MTTDRDFDRLAQAWLELGPDEAPERTVAAILQATETLPQVRRRVRWPAWKDLTMSRSPILIGVWAAVLVAVAGIAVVGRSEQRDAVTQITQTSSIPSGSPANSPPSVSLDPRLVGQWIGDRRPLSEIDLDVGTRLTVLESGTAYLTPADQALSPLLTSTASTSGDTLRLVSRSSRSDCATGDVGTYRWSIVPSGRLLTIEGESDEDCIPRLATFVGTWWRIGCHDVSSGCLGDLSIGTYKSSFIEFHDERPDQSRGEYGNLTYTVPEGWSNAVDSASVFELTPSPDYARTGESPPTHAIDVLAEPAVASQDALCSLRDQPGVDRTVEAMMQAVVDEPALTAENLATIVIDGHPGQMVDLRMARSWTGVCPHTGRVLSAPVIRQTGTDSGWARHMTSADRWRLILLDLGTGRLAAIIISDSESQARFDQLVEESMPIVQSFKFQ